MTIKVGSQVAIIHPGRKYYGKKGPVLRIDPHLNKTEYDVIEIVINKEHWRFYRKDVVLASHFSSMLRIARTPKNKPKLED